MTAERFKIFLAFVLILCAAAFQQSELARFGSLKPNFVLVLLAFFSLYIPQRLVSLLLVIFAGMCIRFIPAADSGALLITGLGLLFLYLRSRWFTHGLVSALALTCIGTLLFYLVGFPRFAYDYSGVVLGELVYNFITLIILYPFLTKLYALSTRSRI